MDSSLQRLNVVQLAAFLGCGDWIVRGVKKANAMAAASAGEALIFTGRYSTPGKISWRRCCAAGAVTAVGIGTKFFLCFEEIHFCRTL
jgi:hypothetical protein